jgi:hypothetical protein
LVFAPNECRIGNVRIELSLSKTGVKLIFLEKKAIDFFLAKEIEFCVVTGKRLWTEDLIDRHFFNTLTQVLLPMSFEVDKQRYNLFLTELDSSSDADLFRLVK